MAEPVVSGESCHVLRESATLRLVQFGVYWQDGVLYLLSPFVTQGHLDVDGHWVWGSYNMHAPERSFSMDGVSHEEVERLRSYWWKWVTITAPED